MSTKYLLAGLAFLLLPACYTAQKQKLLTEEFRTESAVVPLALDGVTVIDGRSGVDERPLALHTAGEARTDSVQPPLTAAHTALIQSELERYFTPRRHAVAVTATLLTGRQSFKGSSMRAIERAEVEVKLSFVNPESGRTLFEAWGSARPEVESSSASAAYSDALYNRALEIALYAAMRRIHRDLASGKLSIE